MLTSSIERSEPSFADANGIRLCYETFGKRTDPPLLLVMGLGAQMIVWNDDFCAELAAQGRYVVRFDNRDIGKSSAIAHNSTPSMAAVFTPAAPGATRPEPPYTLVDMARDTVGLMDALGFAQADVVGASMGGAIAHELAIHFPRRLRSITTIFAPSGDSASPPASPAALANLVTPRPTERGAFIDFYVASWRVLAANHFPFDEARTRREAELSFDRGLNPQGVVRQMMAIVASGNRKEALRATSTRTLVIHGTLDPLVPFPIGEDLAATIPGATFVPIEGMGHSLPRPAWPQILDAIEQHAPGARGTADGR